MDCDSNTCRIENGNTDFFLDGVNRLNLCKRRVDNARTNWDELQRFANAYLATATRLMNFASQAVHVFQASSFCDPNRHSQATIRSRCEWNRAMEDLVSKVFQINARALYLDTVMKELSKECDPSSRRGWPFSQKCEAGRNFDCNYYYGLAMSASDYSNKIGSANAAGKFVFLFQDFSRYDFMIFCQIRYNLAHQPMGFAHGGLFGYWSGGPQLEKGDCEHISYIANSGYNSVFGAVPSFCLQDGFPTCANLIAADELWGDNMNL